MTLLLAPSLMMMETASQTYGIEKSTVFSRSTVGVVIPNSQSIEPFCSNGMRVREVVGTNSTLTPSFFANASARSGPNPTGLPLVSIDPIGGKSLRTPANSVPAALTLASVSPAAGCTVWACARVVAMVAAPSRAPAPIAARLLMWSVISSSISVASSWDACSVRISGAGCFPRSCAPARCEERRRSAHSRHPRRCILRP